MTDAATDTMLTPHWWSPSCDKEVDTPLADLGRHRPRTTRPTKQTPAVLSAPAGTRSSYAAVAANPAFTDSSTDSSEAEEGFTEVRRRGAGRPRMKTVTLVADKPKPSKPRLSSSRFPMAKPSKAL